MDPFKMIYRVYAEEWTRIAAHEAAAGEYGLSKLAERVARLYVVMFVAAANGEDAEAYQPEQCKNIAEHYIAHNDER